ncbi:hypothetical protein AB4Y85_07355 [Microvirga sp. 2YAF29]|uniref:hypothetical protein n=1 Tax=Microvirga sp. 2YAF29 TaxID=3233031 RepID=UPI003F949E23
MAKAKDKKSNKKATGSKLAKTAKKSGLMDLINTDLGREILADALIAAAGAAAAALTKTRAAKRAGSAAANTGAKGVDLTQTAAGAVAGVMSEAARHFLPANLVGEAREGQDRGKEEPKKVKYVNRSSNHSKRKTTKAKSDTAEKR